MKISNQNLTKMPKNKELRFGEVREIPADAAESRRIPFVLSTPTRDRYGTVLNQDNWDLDNYRKNPVVGYMHNLYGDMCNPPDADQIIGKDTDIAVVDMNGMRALVGTPEFEPAEINPLAEKIFRKILFGSLSTTSVGFLEKGEGLNKEDKNEEGAVENTYYFAGQELLEYSIVNIPANPDATKRQMMRMKALREQTLAALMYAWRELGNIKRISEIEEMRVVDVLDLLRAKDLEIKETDPDKVRKILRDVDADERITFLRKKEIGL